MWLYVVADRGSNLSSPLVVLSIHIIPLAHTNDALGAYDRFSENIPPFHCTDSRRTRANASSWVGPSPQTPAPLPDAIHATPHHRHSSFPQSVANWLRVMPVASSVATPSHLYSVGNLRCCSMTTFLSQNEPERGISNGEAEHA